MPTDAKGHNPRKPSSSEWFTTRWPLDEARAAGLCFYNEPLLASENGTLVTGGGAGTMVSFGSYSYLALNGHPRVNAAAQDAIDAWGTGTDGVRLLAGTREIHKALEDEIARFHDVEAALVFSSGYAANVATIAGVSSPRDVLVCDELAHASLADGCRLSGAETLHFRHNDMADLRTCLGAVERHRRKIVIVDGVYSMDGDVCDLPAVVDLCEEFGALLLVDEAHSLGMIGQRGRGIGEHFGARPDAIDIRVGTLSKTLPSVGGYVCGSRALCDFLAFEARTFIYSAALAPPAAAAAREGLRVIRDEPHRVAALRRNADRLRTLLDARRIPYGGSRSAIFPIICGDDWRALELARFCRDRGVFVQAIPYPVVPRGRARLRVCVTSAHTMDHLDLLAEVLDRGFEALAVDRGPCS